MEEYMNQLNQVQTALQNPDCPNRSDLIKLEQDLLELIALLIEENDDVQILEDHSEIEILNEVESDEKLDQNFDDLIGKMCKAPCPKESNLCLHTAQISDVCNLGDSGLKGIASKLMSKMGYVPGRGLGKESQGAVEPVEARLFRKGASLDNCSESSKKLSSFNLKDPLKMAKIRKKKQKLREKCENKQFLREKCKNLSGVFDFINEKLLADEQKKIKKLESTSSKNCPRTKEFDQNLNSLKIRERNLSDEMKNRSNRRNLMKF
uniref:G-patch domain-containing protein n=1 Tax=Romanomermis culicivorax TaxID=13658 RepID=A0A915J6C8_ROMCU